MTVLPSCSGRELYHRLQLDNDLVASYDERLLMGTPAKILGIDPVYAIAGGEVIIDCVGFDTRDPHGCEVLVGDVPAQVVAIGPRRVLAIVPENKGGEVDVRLHKRR